MAKEVIKLGTTHLMTVLLSAGISGPNCDPKSSITCISTLSVAHGYGNIFLCTSSPAHSTESELNWLSKTWVVGGRRLLTTGGSSE